MALLLTRRQLLLGGAGVVAGASLFANRYGAPTGALAAPIEAGPGRRVAKHLVAAERPTALPCFAGHNLPLWTFSDTEWLPVIRANIGDRLDVLLDNRLPRDGEHTSIHWHGIRLPNDQDGIPYLVQPPVLHGESFRYSFAPPDTGTYFFHTHCNESEQLGRGLAGVLIIDGDTVQPYAADETIFLRDWLVDMDSGSFRNFVTKRGAHRAGTFGNVRSANGAVEPEIRLPSSADCRIRLINGDPTRVMEIAVIGADAAVVAIDGTALPPFALKSWLLGPAMRLDLVMRSPAEGGVATLVDQRESDVVRLARFVGSGAASKRTAFDPQPLRAGRIPEPDIASAERLTFTFALAADGAAIAVSDTAGGFPLGPICTSSDSFWTINGRGWPGRDHKVIPPPLAKLDLGRSYVFELKNGTQLLHPIHIHGNTFKVLRSDRRSLPIHHCDTALLTPEETIEVAFVADNPGRWMFHCHVIEHQETGMMGYVEVA
jgi:FtsP/CotA-like multicopper oxidase with cupredoxin domain